MPSRTQGDGFLFTSINGAGVDINSNTSSGNGGDGFQATAFADGAFNNNRATGNTAMGYNFPASPPVPPASAAGNTGSGNGSFDVFPP